MYIAQYLGVEEDGVDHLDKLLDQLASSFLPLGLLFGLTTPSLHRVITVQRSPAAPA